MRRLLALALLPALLAGCADYIPVKDDFGTSALKPSGPMPPEFVEFNNYDPRTNALLSHQMCATQRVVQTQKTDPAEPGELVNWIGPCTPYRVTLFDPPG
jgi:hypothetical protein